MSLYPHPCETVREEMAERAWSRDDLATHIAPDTHRRDWAVARLAIDALFEVCPVNPRCQIGDLAVDIERAFGWPKGFMANLETLWREGLPPAHTQAEVK